jgi:transcriptional regulator with XRE-family HTH domain
MITRIGAKSPIRLFIEAWRVKRALTQQQLADRVGTTKGTISRWETEVRDPPLAALAALADALGIEPKELFSPPDAPTADDLLRSLSEKDRDRVIQFAETLKRTG